MKVGDIFETERCFSQQDFNDFARLSGDNNPIHVDPEYASQTHFGSTVAHGMLLYSGLHSAIKKKFPNSHQIAHQMMFPSATTAGETVHYRFEILVYDPYTGYAKLKFSLVKANGELGLEGETEITLDGDASSKG